MISPSWVTADLWEWEEVEEEEEELPELRL